MHSKIVLVELTLCVLIGQFTWTICLIIFFEPFNYVTQLSPHITNGVVDTPEIIKYGSKCGFDNLNFNDSFQLAKDIDIKSLVAYLIKVEELILSLVFLMQTLKSTTIYEKNY